MFALKKMKLRCSSACSPSWRSAASCSAGACQAYRLIAHSGSATSGCARTRRRSNSPIRMIGAISGAGEAEDDQQRARVAHDQVLDHVHPEQLVGERRQRRDEHRDDQRDAGVEARLAPARDRARRPAQRVRRAWRTGNALIAAGASCSGENVEAHAPRRHAAPRRRGPARCRRPAAGARARAGPRRPAARSSPGTSRRAPLTTLSSPLVLAIAISDVASRSMQPDRGDREAEARRRARRLVVGDDRRRRTAARAERASTSVHGTDASAGASVSAKKPPKPTALISASTSAVRPAAAACALSCSSREARTTPATIAASPTAVSAEGRLPVATPTTTGSATPAALIGATTLIVPIASAR